MARDGTLRLSDTAQESCPYLRRPGDAGAIDMAPRHERSPLSFGSEAQDAQALKLVL